MLNQDVLRAIACYLDDFSLHAFRLASKALLEAADDDSFWIARSRPILKIDTEKLAKDEKQRFNSSVRTNYNISRGLLKRTTTVTKIKNLTPVHQNHTHHVSSVCMPGLPLMPGRRIEGVPMNGFRVRDLKNSTYKELPPFRDLKLSHDGQFFWGETGRGLEKCFVLASDPKKQVFVGDKDDYHFGVNQELYGFGIICLLLNREALAIACPTFKNNTFEVEFTILSERNAGDIEAWVYCHITQKIVTKDPDGYVVHDLVEKTSKTYKVKIGLLVDLCGELLCTTCDPSCVCPEGVQYLWVSGGNIPQRLTHELVDWDNRVGAGSQVNHAILQDGTLVIGRSVAAADAKFHFKILALDGTLLAELPAKQTRSYTELLHPRMCIVLGCYVATAEDDLVRLWRSTGEPIYEYKHCESVSNLQAAADGSLYVGSTRESAILTFDGRVKEGRTTVSGKLFNQLRRSIGKH